MIRDKKQFLSGVLFVCVALFFLWVGADYRMGTVSRMGPGWFPRALSLLLLGIGVACMAISLFGDRVGLERANVMALVVVTISVVVFALLLRPLGFPVAILSMIAIATFAYREGVIDVRYIAVMAIFSLACVVVFIKYLMVPLPMAGYLIDKMF